MKTQKHWLLVLLSLALPIAFQTALFSSKSLIDTVMLGSLNPLDMAAMGLATKAHMVLSFCIIGVAIGGGQVAAQCYGDKVNDKFVRVCLIMLALAAVIALGYAGLVFVGSEAIMAFGSSDYAIIEQGSLYLQIIAPTFVLFAITLSLATVLRTMFKPMAATVVSLIGVALNIALNISFIPKWGITGVAFGTLIAACVETLLLIGFVIYKRWFSFKQIKQVWGTTRLSDAAVVIQLSSVAALNSVIWSLGLYVFHSLLGKQSNDVLIILGALAPIESIAAALLIGFASAASVVIGNHSGQRAMDDIRYLLPRYLGLSLISGLFLSLLLYFCQPLVLEFIASDNSALQETARFAYQILLAAMALKGLSMMFMIGILRAGGDARYCLGVDVFCQWVVLLPLTYYFLTTGIEPVQILLLMIVEEVIKIGLCIQRLMSGRWVKVHSDRVQA
ncbi:putative Multi antimicrobial extrusion protein MatE [Vibrio nigripulchritudo SO65]|uniref:MATE family efflux transporter n=1 Tax=Vibrio nigripulchritudo TaxID=28173 RepID=UPI0003B1C33F|nr:MATE family efflux transporter [Vibrio nigripulchritudo]CCN36111.1 putative Multi antimicrobial extrusion protein MatE [Vibrio nigripulchritudo AM115]CCN39904.1 putative Multi antimicrobial extrusion protein MatE [Vibrio nigripulchritudo FTn2]CCN66479.1 putative Multi antimicrobial extrusion protein MatE [Vibrio nigripulchritudo POn4]CCN77130.1 putative Multi antimicrobial extrusion protein MatE [Vibrio nigripulchritudo SO65]